MDPMTSTTADGTTISAAALAARVEAQERDIERLTSWLAKAAQDATALEAQLVATQRANTALIEHIVDLEHERDIASQLAAMTIQESLDAGHAIAFARDAAPPRQPALTAAPGRCDHCGLPLISAHIADEVIVANGERRAHVHRVCADYLRGQGWQVAARAKEL